MTCEGGDPAFFYIQVKVGGGKVGQNIAAAIITIEAYLPFIIAVISSGALSAIATHLLTRNKTKCEAAKTSVEAAEAALNVVLASIEPMKVQIAELSGKVSVLEDERNTLHAKVTVLEDENRHLTATVGYLKRLVSEAANGERLKTILNLSKEGVLIETPNRQIVHVNRAFLQIWGIPVEVEEILGADCSGAARGLEHLIPDVDAFEAEINNLIGAFRIAIDEPVHLLDGRTLYRTFVPIQHADGSREVAWIYRTKCD